MSTATPQDKNVKPRAIDPRPARTRAAIYAAVRSLSETEEDLAVNDVVRHAGVSRASFYAHFSNLEDVGSAMITEMLQTLEQDTLTVNGDFTIPERVRISVYTAAQLVVDHRAFLRGALRWKVSGIAAAKITSLLTSYWRWAIDLVGDAAPKGKDPDTLARFLAGGLYALYVAWLLDDERGTSDPKQEAFDLSAEVVGALPRWVVGPESFTDPTELIEQARAQREASVETA